MIFFTFLTPQVVLPIWSTGCSDRRAGGFIILIRRHSFVELFSLRKEELYDQNEYDNAFIFIIIVYICVKIIAFFC